MGKKSVLPLVLIFILLLNVGFVLSEELGDNERVKNAFSCLKETIDEKGCDQLSIEEQIFSVLATGKCKNQLLGNSNKIGDEYECWPKKKSSSVCDVEITSKAIYALDHQNENTQKAEDWLFLQRKIPSDLEWYLQIDNKNKTSCKIFNSSGSSSVELANVEVGKNKKIESLSINTCFEISETGYWLKINSGCHDATFSTSCDEDFLTTLVFKKQGGHTYHILDEANSANGGGTTVEKIESYAIGDNYLGNLWATTVLYSLNYDVDAYIPYLITSAESDENLGVFSDPFLYLLTDFLDYKTNTLQSQISLGYWDEIRDYYYSTALALWPFQGDAIGEKDKAIQWLFETQQEDGCWNNRDIIDNAFLLYSIWGTSSGGPGGGGSGGGGNNQSCSDSGNYCMSQSRCDGDILRDYDCESDFDICCTVQETQTTCFGEGGEICESNEHCKGGFHQITDDLLTGEVCCFSGTCEEKSSGGGNGDGKNNDSDKATCESNGGVCEIYSCDEGYSKTSVYSCEYSSDICCIEDGSSSGSYWWIWALAIIIILLILAIVFKDKIKEFILKMQTKMKSGNNSGSSMGMRGPPRTPPGYIRSTQIRPPQRKILPPAKKTPTRRSGSKPPRELDDVLKKLKDMSK